MYNFYIEPGEPGSSLLPQVYTSRRNWRPSQLRNHSLRQGNRTVTKVPYSILTYTPIVQPSMLPISAQQPSVSPTASPETASPTTPQSPRNPLRTLIQAPMPRLNNLLLQIRHQPHPLRLRHQIRPTNPIPRLPNIQHGHLNPPQILPFSSRPHNSLSSPSIVLFAKLK